MRQRERGDGGEKPADVAHQQQEAQHEQQMVDAEQDVLDAEPDIGATAPSAGSGRRRHREARSCDGVRRALRTAPSAVSIRTSTSVMVASSPSMAIFCPARPCVAAHLARAR